LENAAGGDAGVLAIALGLAGRVSRHDLSTREDLLFGHLVGPLLRAEVAEWPILSGLGKQVGTWVEP